MTIEYYVEEWDQSPATAEKYVSLYADNTAEAVLDLCERKYDGSWEYHAPDHIHARREGESEWRKFVVEVYARPRFSLIEEDQCS